MTKNNFPTVPRLICVIYDTIANDVIGPVQLFAHPAPAIRFFGDVAKTENTPLHAHIEDYHLLTLGILQTDEATGQLTIEPHTETLITGAQWKATQQQPNEQ